MRITAIDGCNATCESNGISREVNLYLLQHDAPVTGDYVMVHVGYAIQKVDTRQAEISWALLEQMKP